MVLFPSQEWIDRFQDELNRNAVYEEAARTWEGDFLFLVQPEGALSQPVEFYLDLFHGKCREALMLDTPGARTAAYSLEGPYGQWRKLIAREIEPIKAVLGGSLRIKGNTLKIMRYTTAAKELVRTATEIPTEFL